MAQLPSLKRIQREDVPEAPAWIERVLVPVNNFFQNLYAALANGLTFQDNFAAEVKEFQLIAPATGFLVATEIGSVKGVILLQVSGTGITGAPVLHWVQQGQTVEITDLTELTSGTEYNVRILVI